MLFILICLLVRNKKKNEKQGFENEWTKWPGEYYF